ncbi:hypothetical protein FQN54_002004 [Arachnomyces sp. PD_36]|nr:hypothetical protein FQN54_002004 [Arachnomyces sp. PD_36]
MKFSQAVGSLGLLASAVAPVAAVNFMPLGDSITEFGCWRAYLQGALQEGGNATDVDFIGSMTDTKTCNGVSEWDPNHEGHAGYLAVDVASQYLSGWLSAAAPDVVFFHLGTNDITSGLSTDDIIGAYGQIVELLRGSNPAVQILVAQIIPISFDPTNVGALNEAIPGWAESTSTSESPITVVDCNSGFSDSDLLTDGVHPNDSGDHKIADAVYPALSAALGA